MKTYGQSDPSRIMRMMAERMGTKVITFDKGATLEAISLESLLTDQLKLQYRVRFLPKQVVRRALRQGINPFSFGAYKRADSAAAGAG